MVFKKAKKLFLFYQYTLGTFEKSCDVPRISTGPDIHEIILGSEGIFGVITEAIVKLRPLPETKRYGSIVFPDFESGVACLREIARQRIAPASIRLMDNLQFQLGQVLKPESNSAFAEWLDSVKKWYVLNWKGFEVEKMVAATLVFEGNTSEVNLQEKRVYAIAAQYAGMPGGPENGHRGYFLTWMIAYIRDFVFDYGLMAESFETSVPWSEVLNLCEKVKERVRNLVKEKGVISMPFVSCRVTQVRILKFFFVERVISFTLLKQKKRFMILVLVSIFILVTISQIFLILWKLI